MPAHYSPEEFRGQFPPRLDSYEFMEKIFRNILIIKPGAIGDLLQLTPVIRALKEKFPAARISLVVGNLPSMGLFRHNPLVSEVIVFDRKGEHRSWSAFAALWRRLHAAHYDLVLNFQRSNLKGWLLATAAFPCRVLVYHKSKDRNVHAVVNHLETLAPLGISSAGMPLEFHPGPEAEAFAAQFFGAEKLTGRTVIALNPGASHAVNRWSTVRFAELADRLAEDLAARVIIVGGREDVPLAEEIVAKARCAPVVLTGMTDLLQLGAVLQRCALLVSGDTGPMHMATAVGTRVVALFGAADPARTGPVGSGHRVVQAAGVDCVPCRSRRCSSAKQLECMTDISVEEVLLAVESILAGKDRSQ
jgi:lipopolysaccharide heptosyltransferase II